jgi:hypothetical protein
MPGVNYIEITPHKHDARKVACSLPNVVYDLIEIYRARNEFILQNSTLKFLLYRRLNWQYKQPHRTEPGVYQPPPHQEKWRCLIEQDFPFYEVKTLQLTPARLL